MYYEQTPREKRKETARIWLWGVGLALALVGIVALFVFGIQTIDDAVNPGRTPATERIQDDVDTPDCDHDDLYGPSPDPDCHGLWYGTPKPAVGKTRAPATVRKTATPRRTR